MTNHSPKIMIVETTPLQKLYDLTSIYLFDSVANYTIQLCEPAIKKHCNFVNFIALANRKTHWKRGMKTAYIYSVRVLYNRNRLWAVMFFGQCKWKTVSISLDLHSSKQPVPIEMINRRRRIFFSSNFPLNRIFFLTFLSFVIFSTISVQWYHLWNEYKWVSRIIGCDVVLTMYFVWLKKIDFYVKMPWSLASFTIYKLRNAESKKLREKKVMKICLGSNSPIQLNQIKAVSCTY